VVIGGGDTGTDCVATALRHGCASVTQLEILARPPRHRSADNPWPEYPLVYKLDYGQEEAKAIQGDDPRQYLMMTKAFEVNEDGQVAAIKAIGVEWQTIEGRKQPVEIPGSETRIEADLVLLAMGFVGAEPEPFNEIIEFDDRGNINAEYGRYETSEPGVFAAGDCRRGQSLVVWAINEGREAAAACNEFITKL
jgi:glutamate synthase (NADPH/NADH) small chain